VRAPPPLRLGVNVDHVATLRQARGTPYPDPVEAARAAVRGGAAGITVHLREDRRHIREDDVRRLRAEPGLALNLEMAAAPAIVDFALAVRPDEVCLVPERRQELTTEGGLDVVGQRGALTATTGRLLQAGIAVSLFIEPSRVQIEAAAALGVPYVELHTGRFCDARDAGEASAELARLVEGARAAHAAGLRVNAGHGIHTGNLAALLAMPHLDTLNIGHSLVARAVFVGLEAAVREMRAAMDAYRGGSP